MIKKVARFEKRKKKAKFYSGSIKDNKTRIKIIIWLIGILKVFRNCLLTLLLFFKKPDSLITLQKRFQRILPHIFFLIFSIFFFSFISQHPFNHSISYIFFPSLSFHRLQIPKFYTQQVLKKIPHDKFDSRPITNAFLSKTKWR